MFDQNPFDLLDRLGISLHRVTGTDDLFRRDLSIGATAQHPISPSMGPSLSTAMIECATTLGNRNSG
jgi:hypothetical protein